MPNPNMPHWTSGWTTGGRVLTGKRTPDRRNWGASTIGMNWMIWSSVRANVERKIPRLTAPTASSRTTRNARTGLPTMPTPRPTEKAGSGPRAGTWTLARTQTMSRATWSVANRPKPTV